VDALTNRISGSGYDAAGSMTSWGDGGTTYSYAYYPTNEMKQMVGDGRTTLFGYSADGERVGTYDSVTGGITYVLRGLDHKPLRQYREYNGGWTWQKDWVYRDGLLLATVESTGTKYVHLDHLGTPRRITNSSRAVIASHDYYPFGEEITASSQDSEALKFTGHERDLRDPSKTTDDLDYMHARYYNPWIGRFLSTDPIGGTPGTPQSWNRYSYVLDNPIKFLDPTGAEASVLVVGPGTGPKEEWGHAAIFVSTEDYSGGITYGGKYDFAKGKDAFIGSYTADGRTVTEFKLGLTPEQEGTLAEFVKANPDGAVDHSIVGSDSMATQNCTTACGNALEASGAVPAGSNPGRGLFDKPANLQADLDEGGEHSGIVKEKAVHNPVNEPEKKWEDEK
jgi:RHS repeat-associated protein